MFGVEFCYPLLKPRDGLGLALCDSGQRRRKRHSLFLGKHADSLDVHAKCESATAIQRNHFLIKLPPPIDRAYSSASLSDGKINRR